VNAFKGWKKYDMQAVRRFGVPSGWVVCRLENGWEFSGFGQERIIIHDLNVTGGIQVGTMEFKYVDGSWEVSYGR